MSGQKPQTTLDFSSACRSLKSSMKCFSSLKQSKKKFRWPIVAVTFENGSKNLTVILLGIDAVTYNHSFNQSITLPLTGFVIAELCSLPIISLLFTTKCSRLLLNHSYMTWPFRSILHNLISEIRLSSPVNSYPCRLTILHSTEYLW